MTNPILRRFLLAFTLVLITTACAETEQPRIWGPRLSILPPAEFDRPFPGRLTLVRVQSHEEIRKACPRATLGLPAPLACSRHLSDFSTCDVFMMPDSVIIAFGYVPDEVYRHELGHCNGWRH